MKDNLLWQLRLSSSGGHFSAAIVQSGPLDFVGKADANKPLNEIHQIFAQKMGCDEVNKVVDCLRHKSVKELMVNMNMFDEYNSKLLFLLPIILI